MKSKEIAISDGLEGALREAIVQYQIPFKFADGGGLQDAPSALLADDSGGNLVFYNHAAQDVFGYTHEEAIGMPSIDLVPTEEDHQAATGIMAYREKMFNKILNDKVSIRVDSTIRKTKSGELITISGHVFPYEFRRGRYSIAAVVEKI